MILPILTEPNKLLHQKADDVASADLASEKIKKIINDMAETMNQKGGVGLAAPQVGEPVRIIIIAKEYNPTKSDKIFALINPVWEKKSLLKREDEEGCLSVPGVYGKVKRYKKIFVRALSASGKELKFTAEDLFARIIQHEVDHLDGILFIEKARDLHKVEKSL